MSSLEGGLYDCHHVVTGCLITSTQLSQNLEELDLHSEVFRGVALCIYDFETL